MGTERIHARDVEFFCWEKDPNWNMSAGQYEWLLEHGRDHLAACLVKSAKTALANNRLRVWYEQRHTSLVFDYADHEYIRQHVEVEVNKKPRFDSLFASVYVCRICMEKLWSGLTINRLMPPSARKLVDSHALLHIVDAMVIDELLSKPLRFTE